VLLPAFAEDITPDTPVQEVFEFSEQSCAVRKADKATTSEYSLSGLPLKRSKPVREGWWLRGAALLLSLLYNRVTRIISTQAAGYQLPQ
jgi:hypothetical protein